MNPCAWSNRRNPNASLNSNDKPETADSFVTCESSEGIELHAGLVRLTRHQAVVEVYTPQAVIRVSENLNNFRIILQDRVVYSGQAVVTSIMGTSTVLVCEVSLGESWHDVELMSASDQGSRIRTEFSEFMQTCQRSFKILPSFKLVIADMQVVLQDLRQWLEQLELRVFAQPSGSRQQFENDHIHELQGVVLPLLGTLFEKFEETCLSVPNELIPAHRAYVKRQLHPLVLCSPFMYRTFHKPLGYAGDYEMVNMMVRNPMEGASIFAKLLNTFFLSTAPVVAHRNRLDELKRILREEVIRTSRNGHLPRIFNLGCGPAREVQDFIVDPIAAHEAQFTLLDFNDETIQHVGSALNNAMNRAGRKMTIQLIRKGVAQVLKEAAKPVSTLLTLDWDFVYCAGLFDYMPDPICQQLMATFYRMLRPGGLLIGTNVAQYNPSRNWMEFAVDWHLTYRDANYMQKLVPAAAPLDSFRIWSEPTGVNTFVEIRKPCHG